MLAATAKFRVSIRYRDARRVERDVEKTEDRENDEVERRRREETRWRMDNRKSARRKVDERGATERHERMLEARDGRETRRKRAGTRTRTKRDETETDRESAGAGRDGQIETVRRRVDAGESLDGPPTVPDLIFPP